MIHNDRPDRPLSADDLDYPTDKAHSRAVLPDGPGDESDAHGPAPYEEIRITTTFGQHRFGRALARAAVRSGLSVEYFHNGQWSLRTHLLRVTGPRAKTFCVAVMQIAARIGKAR
ncbi:hypothetical protein [Actinomadura hibisca]|uniref:hypothetical protein n=1 Tax=Actinomadura hibisca TaxID=68565 RepID=UPI00082C2FB9|nr:hypothetical protein [Actinomadura hibisca]